MFDVFDVFVSENKVNLYTTNASKQELKRIKLSLSIFIGILQQIEASFKE